jgi:hypothetical protein
MDRMAYEIAQEAREGPEDGEEEDGEGETAECASEEDVWLGRERVVAGEDGEEGHVQDCADGTHGPHAEVVRVEPVLLRLTGVDEEEPEAEFC